MSIKKMCLLAALFALLIMPFGAFAADVSSCTIDKIGFYPGISAGSSGGVVFLTDNAATPAWSGSRMFYISSELGNEGLATLLTAYSMGKTVLVRIGGSAAADPVAGSLINVIYVNN